MHDQFQLTFILIDNNANLEITEFLTCQDAFACLLELKHFATRQDIYAVICNPTVAWSQK